jgi:hypothetical protein
MKHENLYTIEGEAKAESKKSNSVTHLLRWLVDDRGDFFIIKTFENGTKTDEALFDAKRIK